ncbi:MAG: cysteate synthase [Bacteroidota bacterium]|nr:cysteate synthase [Bacteroidota bacterium]
MPRFTPTQYELMNVADGRVFKDKGWTLVDPESAFPSLVRAVYNEKLFTPREDLEGIYRYASWLPIRRILKNAQGPVTYRSKGLARELGLKNLYITFTGYAPEIGAEVATCSFKATEAYSVCARLPKKTDKILVVQSAGNTARAFAQVCSDNNIPIVICIPRDNIDALWFHKRLRPCVKIISSPRGSDYFDAIQLGDKLCRSERFLAEGGAKNVARRDGMGTTLLSAVEAIGELPDAYFQAVGSGTGTIAVWENNLRLIDDGRFGRKKTRLYAAQNAPFTLMYDSWKAHQRALVPMTAEEGRMKAAEIDAKVLSNRKPPYSLAGGLFDALEDSKGDMYKVTNEEINYWKRKFNALEHIDIYSAAACAVASLAMAVKDGSVKKNEIVMLNCTGGGEESAKAGGYFMAVPDLVLSPDLPEDQIIDQVSRLFD